MHTDRIVNLEDFRRTAKQALPRFAFDFIEGGVEDEACIARNRAAFERHELVPRYLVDVAQRDQSVELFGRRYASPIGISPTGIAGFFRVGADRMLAEAAAAANIPFVLSSGANLSYEAAVAVAPETTWIQIYGARDWAITRDQVRRAADSGAAVLMLTVDVPVVPRRERNLRNRFGRPLKVTPWMIFEALRHPRWLVRHLTTAPGTPMLENWRAYATGGDGADDVADLFGRQTPANGQTWRTLEAIRELWPRSLVVKGVLHPEDAKLAADIGVDGIMVSNHGGRQLDRAPAAIDMLPAVHAATAGRTTLLLDSGVRRGLDVLVALCLGAKAAFIGRPTLYAAAAAGRAGVDRALEILRLEIDTNLAQLGCPSLAGLGPLYLRQAQGREPDRAPVQPPPATTPGRSSAG